MSRLEELRKRRMELSKKSDETLKHMEVIAMESIRSANVAKIIRDNKNMSLTEMYMILDTLNQ